MSARLRTRPTLGRAAGLLAALIGAACWPAGASAHEHWLQPDAFQADTGRAVAIGVRVGEGLCGPARPYHADRTIKFAARLRRSLDLAPLAAEGDTAWTRLMPADRRGLLVTWESNFVSHRMDGPRFDAYLEEEGLAAPLAARRAARDTSAGRERYRRCSKVWIAGPDSDPLRACSAIGMPLEIVPIRLPGADSVMAVRVLFMGAPLADALVRAWRAPLGESGLPRICVSEPPGPPHVWQGRTNKDGIAWVPCATPGQWLIGSVHMVKSADRAQADWESNWASYGFARPAESRRR